MSQDQQPPPPNLGAELLRVLAQAMVENTSAVLHLAQTLREIGAVQQENLKVLLALHEVQEEIAFSMGCLHDLLSTIPTEELFATESAGEALSLVASTYQRLLEDGKDSA